MYLHKRMMVVSMVRCLWVMMVFLVDTKHK